MHGSLVMIIHTYRDIVYVLEYIFQNFDYLWAQFYACKQIWLSSCFVTIVTGGGGGGGGGGDLRLKTKFHSVCFLS